MAKTMRVQAGTLLAAWPDLLDPNFMHGVVLICHHTEAGAYGLVTNRESEFSVGELLSDHELLGKSDFPIHLGGPVDHNSLQFLHSVPDKIEGGFSIDGRIWLGGDLDQMARYILDERAAAERSLRIFLGYSGWGSGQLESELRIGSWLPAAPSMEAIFGGAGEEVWRDVVRSVGGPADGLENQPPDVSWN